MADEDDSADLYPCDNPIEKLKVGTYFKKDAAGKEDEHYQTWLNLAVKLDHYKTVSVRSATGILDFLGDVGGFEAAATLIFASMGVFFSSRFVVASLAQDLFIEKNEGYTHKSAVDLKNS